MSVYLLMEFTCPKDEERNKKRLKHEKDWAYPYFEKKIKEGVTTVEEVLRVTFGD